MITKKYFLSHFLTHVLFLTFALGGEQVHFDGLLKTTDTFATGNCDVTAQEGDLVTYLSWGYLRTGVLFDVGEYEIKIGQEEAPEGIDQGIRGLCQGDKRALRIHHSLAYGETGLDNRVPANSVVLYDVEILKIDRESGERLGLKTNDLLEFRDTNEVKDCGLKVQGGDTISWHYIGTLSDGTGFDTGNFQATIDNRQVITGVNEAMKGLCVGGKRRMVMHHSYAYGSRGRPKIPPYSNLVFDVHLKSISRPDVGTEDLETKQRTSQRVSTDNPVHVQDQGISGNCEIKVTSGDHVTYWRTGYLLTGQQIEDKQTDTIIVENTTTMSHLEKSLLGLCVEDKRSVILHPTATFSDRPKSVPLGATVVYDIRVESIARQSESTKNEAHTGLKPNQKLRIEVMETVDECKMKSQEGDTLSWSYRGMFLDGTEFYKGTFTAKLGANQVIVGLDKGMRSMCVGEKRRLTVHSDWAYGDEGRPPAIPPKSTLVFENVLNDIERHDEL